MEHEALTVSDDQKQLLDGAVAAGVFQSRSSAIREVLAAYFESDIHRTAALVATDDRVNFRDTTALLDVDVEEFADCVMEINPDAVPERLKSHLSEDAEDAPADMLEDIEAEFQIGEDAGESE